MSRFREGMARLTARLESRGGVAITIKRGTGTATPTTAVAGTQADGVELPGRGSAGRVDDRRRDYLVAREKYLVGGVAVEPKPGDLIAETINGTVCTFQVQPPEAEPAWRWCDEDRTCYRVHTVRVA